MTDEPATTLTLIRHGESNVTVNRVIGGHRSCSGLSDLGRQQAERLRERLANTGELAADVLIASNFPRAIETAEMIASALGNLAIDIDPGFGEHDPGPEIDGMTFDGYVEQFGMPDWSDPDVDVFPGGETIAAFHFRVGSALGALIEAHRGKSIVVACHGGVVGHKRLLEFKRNMQRPVEEECVFFGNSLLAYFFHAKRHLPGDFWRIIDNYFVTRCGYFTKT